MRMPVAAGRFYLEGKEDLTAELKSFFKAANTKPTCRAVVSPHAGYMYSGRTAAWAIGSLKKAETIVVLGPNHSGVGPEFGINKDQWQTPLGTINPNNSIINEMTTLGFIESAKDEDHSIEVQLPFLQQRLGKFLLVPILINQYSDYHFINKCMQLGKFLSEKNVSIVASSDFSHYLPADKAEKFDRMAIEKIMQMNVRGFFNTVFKNGISICGYGPIAVAMSFASELKLRPEILHKSNSGDATGDYGSVVSYYAIGFRPEAGPESVAADVVFG